MLKKHTRHFEEEGRAYYISTNQCAKLAIQIQVKHRRKYKSQDHQAGRWQHSCAWQRIIQPWAMITAQLRRCRLLVSFLRNRLFPESNYGNYFHIHWKRALDQISRCRFFGIVYSRRSSRALQTRLCLYLQVVTKYSCCDTVQLQLNFSKHSSGVVDCS